MSKEWRDSLATMLLSWILGELGIDRFYRGQIGLGVLKLLTAGGAGIWWLVDAIIATIRFGEENRK
ncbi:MAG: TM2 domain-containing protein [Bacteroidetes bacterium]|nr:TM2 domain-containing protein [Bacteroidota bacterium]